MSSAFKGQCNSEQPFYVVHLFELLVDHTKCVQMSIIYTVMHGLVLTYGHASDLTIFFF